MPLHLPSSRRKKRDAKKRKHHIDSHDAEDEGDQTNVSCPVCLDFSLNKINEITGNGCDAYGGGDRWMSKDDIRSSAEACHICSLLRDAVETFLSEGDFGQDTRLRPIKRDKTSYSVSFRNAKLETLRTLQLDVRCGLGDDRAMGGEEITLEVYTAGKNASDIVPLVKDAGEVPNNPSFEECAAIIHGWVQRCQSNHAACRSSARIEKPMPLPKRILDVANDKVVLIETQVGDKGLYVALSHSWGTGPAFVTNRDNITHRKQGINIEEMTPNFQDAVRLTRALDLQYLWIDSLCIVQGDVEDWAQQSAVMADIYAGSYLNIAATRSAGGQDGFIGPRWTSRDTLEWEKYMGHFGVSDHVPHIRKCNVTSLPVTSSDGSREYPQTLRVRLDLNSSHETLQTPRWVGMHRHTAPLVQRGWVYQERNLSPRTVHFHANEMMWECGEQQLCECGQLDHLPPGGDGWGASKIRLSDLSPLRADATKLLHGLWRTAVEDYCELALTFESDRLPALAGLATRFAEYMSEDDEYLAGLWRSTLARDLLWTVAEDGGAGKRMRDTARNLPPSWSWASMFHGPETGTLGWEWETKPKLADFAETWRYEQDRRFSIINAWVDGNEFSKYTGVTKGKITVKGVLCAISVSKKMQDWPTWVPQVAARGHHNDFNSLHLHYDDPQDEKEVARRRSSTNGFIFCLFIGTFISHFDHSDSEHFKHRGLILKPVQRESGDGLAFQRIGSWTQHIEHWAEKGNFFTKRRRDITTLTIV